MGRRCTLSAASGRDIGSAVRPKLSEAGLSIRLEPQSHHADCRKYEAFARLHQVLGIFPHTTLERRCWLPVPLDR